MNDEQREEIVQKYLSRYPGKLGFAGSNHPRIKQVKALQNNTKPNPGRLVALEGIWALEMAKKHGIPADCFVFSPEMIYSPEAEALVDHFVQNSRDAWMVSQKVFSRIGEKDNTQGVLALTPLPRWDPDDLQPGETSLVVVLDGLEIPGNIGTILRTMDGVGGDAVFICNHRARLTHPKMLRGSHGAILYLPVLEMGTEEIIRWLQRHDYRIYLTDTDATMQYCDATYHNRVALVAGSERYGITREWYETDHQKVFIPMRGECDSLNVAVSTAIFLYEAGRQVSRTGQYKVSPPMAEVTIDRGTGQETTT